MKVDLGEVLVIVTLSRRNLLALLAKLDESESKRTIVSGACYRGGVLLPGMRLVLRAESDEEHYANRPGPGAMSAETELVLRMIDEPEGWA